MTWINGNGGKAKKLITLITSFVVLVGMFFTASWQLDARVEKKVDDKVYVVKTSFENKFQQFEIQTTGAMESFQRTQDIRYYQSRLEYYRYVYHRLEVDLMRCGNCSDRSRIISELDYVRSKISEFERLLERVLGN